VLRPQAASVSRAWLWWCWRHQSIGSALRLQNVNLERSGPRPGPGPSSGNQGLASTSSAPQRAHNKKRRAEREKRQWPHILYYLADCLNRTFPAPRACAPLTVTVLKKRKLDVVLRLDAVPGGSVAAIGYPLVSFVHVRDVASRKGVRVNDTPAVSYAFKLASLIISNSTRTSQHGIPSSGCGGKRTA